MTISTSAHYQSHCDPVIGNMKFVIVFCAILVVATCQRYFPQKINKPVFASVFSNNGIYKGGNDGRYTPDNSGSYNNNDGKYHPDNTGSYVHDNNKYNHLDDKYKHQGDQYKHQADRFGNGGAYNGNGNNGNFNGNNGNLNGNNGNLNGNKGNLNGNNGNLNGNFGNNNLIRPAGSASGNKLSGNKQEFDGNKQEFGGNKYQFTGNAGDKYDNRNYRILKQVGKNEQDGYHYLYETENGILAEEQGKLANIATDQEGMKAHGFYTYTGPDNVVYTVRYTADENGFIPEGAHIPTPPPIPAAILRSLEYQRALGKL